MFKDRVFKVWNDLFYFQYQFASEDNLKIKIRL